MTPLRAGHRPAPTFRVSFYFAKRGGPVGLLVSLWRRPLHEVVAGGVFGGVA